MKNLNFIFSTLIIVIDRSSSDVEFTGAWSQKPNIYWCDAKFDHIARADEDFKNVHIIYRSPSAREEHIFSMALFGDFIYFSDWKKTRSIMRIHKFCTVGMVSFQSFLLSLYI